MTDHPNTQFFADRLKEGFNKVSRLNSPDMDALHAVYDESYVLVTEAFEACKDDIYTDNKDTPIVSDDEFLEAFDGDFLSKDPADMFPQIFGTSEEGAPDHIRDYFETIQVLAENAPDQFNYNGGELESLKQAFKEALLLAKDHLHERLAYRNTNGDTKELYYDTAEILERALM